MAGQHYVMNPVRIKESIRCIASLAVEAKDTARNLAQMQKNRKSCVVMVVEAGSFVTIAKIPVLRKKVTGATAVIRSHIIMPDNVKRKWLPSLTRGLRIN